MSYWGQREYLSLVYNFSFRKKWASNKGKVKDFVRAEDVLEVEVYDVDRGL